MSAAFLVSNMIIDELFHIMQDFSISPMSSGSHFVQDIGPGAAVIDCRGLRMKHEWDSEETLDPLDQLISTMGFKCVLNAVSRRHLRDLVRFQLQVRELRVCRQHWPTFCSRH